MHVVEGSGDPDASGGTVNGLPRLAVVLRLHTRLPQTPTRHTKMAKLLEGENWHKIERTCHSLVNTQLYKHSKVDGAAFGIHLSGEAFVHSNIPF